MKSTLTLAIFLLCTSIYAFDMSVHYARFQTIEENYVEFNYYVVGATLSIPNSVDVDPSVIMTMIIKKEGRIIYADKFNVIGFKDRINFAAVKRYGLKPGMYNCSLVAVDANDSENVYNWEEEIVVANKSPKFSLSDIQLLSSINKAEESSITGKNGYDLECLPFLYSENEMGKIYYYVESYNSNILGEQYVLQIDVVENYKNRPNTLVKKLTKKRKSTEIDILVGAIEISDLPSGNYKVKMYVGDEGNPAKIVESSFQHSNKNIQKSNEISVDLKNSFEFLDILSKKDMTYALMALVPRISSTDLEEVNLALQSENLSKIKHLLKYHWNHFGGSDIERTYYEYMIIARAVDKKFDSGFGEGFETDRGFYYLKYGRPDNIVAENNDVNAPPYEIWTYNDLPEIQQTNVKFVFYNPSLSPGNFVLLHSNAKGEINNPRWRVEITNNDGAKGAVDRLNGTEVEDGFGQNSGRYYDDN